MVKRVHLIAWSLGAAVPLGGWLYGKPEFAAMTAVLYVLGWGSLLLALARNPDASVMRGLSSRVTWVSAVTASLVLLIVAFRDERSTVVVLLSFIVTLWTFWAFSRTPAALAKKLGRTLLLAYTLAFCLIATEATLRVIDTQRPNNGNGWTWGHRVRSNSLGFREREFAVPKPPGTYRIMVLGDSLTWGAGLAEEERYSNLLEKRLREVQPGLDIEVVNFGLSGCPTVGEQEILAEHIDRVEPDQIVVGFCINDPQPKSENYAVELEKYRWAFEGANALHDVGATRLGWFLRLRIDSVLRNTGLVPSSSEALDRVYQRDSPEWHEFQQALRDIKQMSDDRGIPSPIFAALLQGTGDFSRPDESLSYILKWSRQASDAALQAGFEVVVMEPEFRQQGYRDRSVNAWDGHPSAECNEVYARHLSNTLQRTIARDQSRLASRPNSNRPQ